MYRRALSTLLMAAGLTTGVAVPAHAAEVGPSMTEQERCAPWDVAQVFQTSFTWARVSQTVCTVERGNEVTARLKIRLDWPTDCDLMMGCDPRTLTKQEKLKFDEFSARVEYAFPESAPGVVDDATLADAGTTLTENDGSGVFGFGAEVIRSVDSPWVPLRSGPATISGYATVDIDNDGNGAYQLDPTDFDTDL